MAHQIEINDKQQGLKQAWHGLTEVLPEITFANNWLAQWDVVPRGLYFKAGVDSNGKPIPAHSGFKVFSCSDKPDLVIGKPFGDSYGPITNKDFLDCVEGAISGTDHKIVSVGSVRNRGRIFLTVQLGGLAKFTVGKRSFLPFLNFLSSHDQSATFMVNTSNVCTVCDNTFSVNLNAKVSGDDVSAKVKHTKNAKLRLENISKVIDQAIGVQAEFAQALGEMETRPITKQDAFRAYIGFVAPKGVKELSARTANQAKRLTQLFAYGRGNEGRNVADLFNGATDYYSHESAGKDTDMETRMEQFESSEFGSGADRKQEMFAICSEPARVKELIAKGAELLN